MQTKPVYLNGRHIRSAESFEVINPSTGDSLARMSSIGREEVGKAITDAHEAWKGWRRLTALERGDLLLSIAEAMTARFDELAETITRENGKPLAQSKSEVSGSIDHFRWFAEEGRRAYGRVIPNQSIGNRHMVLKVPVGVVAAITPWNFPLILAARKVAPALAAGCPVILRPASQTPLSSVILSECVGKAGLPPGVFQLIAGPAQPIASELMANPLCRKVSFTGSTKIGRELIHGSADTVTNLSLELGGLAPVLIFDDADLDQAVEGSLIAKFRNTGQSCIAANRILVQKGIYNSFIDRFCRRIGELKVGDGFEPGVDIGPLVNQEAFESATTHIEDALARGAKLLCGGNRKGEGNGFFLEPTVLGKVPDSALCTQEETFAPIAPVGSFDTEEEAITQANSSEFGLASYVFTKDINRALRLMEEIEAGMIGINDSVLSTSQAPFGGVKQSGMGRELGIEGLDAFLETKHISIGGLA